MDDTQTTYDELYAYTMGRPGFILQHVVDAFGAQRAAEGDKPIRLVFSLIGLYLHVEKGLSGRAVQRAHMLLGQRKRDWPPIRLPAARGEMTVLDVMTAPEGDARDAAIDAWCRAVWEAFRDSRPVIVELLREYDIQCD